MIRPATTADIQHIIDSALMVASEYPGLRPDKGKIKTMVSKSISSPACYTSVVTQGDTVCGCLMSVVQDHLWAERKVAHIPLWTSSVPGAGYALLRDFVSWLQPRRGVKLAGVSPDYDWDPRTEKLLLRAGFVRSGGSYLYYN